jgi:pimeloyl-ACP methyl ester carboxylesterase
VSGAGGHDPRTPIVLLHGATASSRVWQEVAPALEADYRVLAPNLAGHRGGPPLSTEPHRVVPGIVEGVCRELDAAGIPTAHLVGNSLGGWVALALARPGRARSVVAISPAGAWRSARDLTRLLTLFREGGAVARTRTGRRLAMNPRTRRLLWRATAEHTERMTLSQVHDTFEDLAGCAILTDLLAGAKRAGPILPFGSVACPTLIAWGSSRSTATVRALRRSDAYRAAWRRAAHPSRCRPCAHDRPPGSGGAHRLGIHRTRDDSRVAEAIRSDIMSHCRAAALPDDSTVAPALSGSALHERLIVNESVYGAVGGM